MTRLVTPALLLRIAAGLTLFYAAGHTMGANESWSPPGETDVLRSMRAFEFEVMGATRTYWHFYMGFGLYISVLLLLQAVLLWQLGSVASVDPKQVRPIAGTLAIASIVATVVVWKFIFIMPALFSLACSVCLALAFAATRPRTTVS